MGFFSKIATLFKVRGPAQDLIGEIKTAQSGWKTIGFWVTLLGTLVSLVLSIKMIIPATAALVIISVLTAAYNVLRGAQKADTDTTRGVFRSTEFWLGVGGEVTKLVVALQAGGVNPAWLTSLSAMVATGMSIGQSLSAQNLKTDPLAPEK